MRLFQTSTARLVPRFALLIAALFLCLWPLRADEISFVETYSERLTPDDEVIWSGSSTLDIVLPWNGFNIDELDGNTGLRISIGEFQFDQILDGAENSFDPDVRSARFRETGFDNEGNQVDLLFVDVTWNTKTFTISGVFRNFSNAGDPNFFGVPSHLGVAGSFQETDSAQITFGALNANYPVAVTGRTTLSRRVVEEEEIFLNSIELSGEADLPPNDKKLPTVSITSPTANGRLLMPVITGKASDNVGVDEVFYRIGDDEFALADGTNNWSANVSLQPGTNVVKVKSVDLAGNESVVLTRTFFYVVTAPLTVEIDGNTGTTTLTNNQLLELGKTYSITARPATGFIFRDWLGTINSQSATISFVMEPNFVLQPSFIPNPFIPIQGVYSGLFSDTNGATPTSAGYFTVTVKGTGAFSGRILLGGVRHSFSGVFPANGIADKTILRRGKPALNLHMQLGFDGGLSGTVTQDSVSSDLEAELAQSTTNSARTKYTLLIPPTTDPVTAPGGYGFGSVGVDLKGNLRFKGVLGDKTSMSQKTMVSRTGRWPLFVSHSRGRGVLLGWLSFINELDSDIRGENVTWAKLPSALDRFYPNGFTNSGTVIGSLYSPPLRGMTIFNSPNPVSGSLEISGGNLSAPITNTFLLSTNNKLTVTSTNKTTLSISSSSGLLKGSFTHPDTRKAASIKGAILQKSMWGGGVFLGTNQSGSLLLQPDP